MRMGCAFCLDEEALSLVIQVTPISITGV